MEVFDATETAALLKSEARIRRAPRTFSQRRSALDLHKFELLELDKAECSLGELELWLFKKRLNVHRSTIHRWLKKNRGDT